MLEPFSAASGDGAWAITFDGTSRRVVHIGSDGTVELRLGRRRLLSPARGLRAHRGRARPARVPLQRHRHAPLAAPLHRRRVSGRVVLQRPNGGTPEFARDPRRPAGGTPSVEVGGRRRVPLALCEVSRSGTLRRGAGPRGLWRPRGRERKRKTAESNRSAHGGVEGPACRACAARPAGSVEEQLRRVEVHERASDFRRRVTLLPSFPPMKSRSSPDRRPGSAADRARVPIPTSGRTRSCRGRTSAERRGSSRLR